MPDFLRHTGPVEAEVEVRSEPFCIDAKRLYLPIVIKATCPNCGAQVVHDLDRGGNSLSYPALNSSHRVSIMHIADGEECCEFSVKVRLTISASIAST